MARKAESTEPQFVLKHRITGAGIMLAFGVIVLPWLLGPPDEQDIAGTNKGSVVVVEGEGEGETQEVSKNVGQVDDFNDAALTDESLKKLLIESIEQESIEQEEQVYISKITPLDSGGVQAVDENEVVKTPKKTDSKSSQQQVVQESEKKSKPATVEKLETKQKTEPKLKPALKPKPIPVAKNNEADSKGQLSAQLKDEKVVEVGWMVSVGVFSQQKNVEAMMKSLQNKGFTPRTSIFETNKGAATRVWLGPFELRVDAAKAKTKLKEKTGDLGLIKAYP